MIFQGGGPQPSLTTLPGFCDLETQRGRGRLQSFQQVLPGYLGGLPHPAVLGWNRNPYEKASCGLACPVTQLREASWARLPACESLPQPLSFRPPDGRTGRFLLSLAPSALPPSGPQRCPLSHLWKRFVLYAGALCSTITLWLVRNARFNLLQALFDPSSVLYLQYKGLSLYPPTLADRAHRACITVHN